MASIGAGICLLTMMFITVISVFGRYVLQVDLIPGAYNMVERIVYPLLVFWALPLAHQEGNFPRLEIVPDMLNPTARRIVSIVILLFEIAIYGVLFWFICSFVWDGIRTGRQMQIGTDVWPLWPVIVMMPLAFSLMLLEMIRLISVDARRLLSRDAEQSE